MKSCSQRTVGLLLVILVCLVLPLQASAAITYFASASTPVDGNNYDQTTVAVTPPASMQLGDLVILVANSREATMTLAMSATGGQAWTSETANTTNASQRIFWATFNGTWSANPSVSFPSGANGTTVVMHVFRPDSPSYAWAIDVTTTLGSYSAPSNPYDVTIPGITTVTAGAMVFATWASRDNNTWALQTGGWANAGNAQYRNGDGNDTSQSSAYKVMATAGASGSVTNRQASRGGDSGNRSIMAFKAVPLLVDDNRVECPTAGYTSIQAAVNAAAPGQTITVCQGTYAERVNANKNSLTIAGRTGNPDDVVIRYTRSGESAGQEAVSVNGSSVTLSALTIIADGSSRWHGVDLVGANPRLTSVKVSSNADGPNAGTSTIVLKGATNVTIDGTSTVTTTNGYGITNIYGSTTAIVNPTFSGLTIDARARGIYIAHGDANVAGTVNLSNVKVTSARWDAVRLYSAGGVTHRIDNVTATANASGGDAYAFVLSNGSSAGTTAIITNSTFTSSATNANGYGALSLRGISGGTMSGSTIQSPLGPTFIYNNVSGVTFSGNVFRTTQTTSNYGTLWNYSGGAGNTFTDNCVHGVTRLAGVGGDRLDNGSRGNYWSDNTNCGTPNASGICPNPYTSYGGAVDRYPLSSCGGPPPLDHIRLEHSGSGVTCAPTTLTIKACANAACSSFYTGGVTGSLTATGSPMVNWVGGAGFTIGVSGITTKDVQVTTAGTVTWGASGLSVAPTNGVACYVGGTSTCSFTSALSGFLFDVPNHVSDTSQSITVSAVKQADNSLACTPAFASASKTVNFNCGYSNPVTGTLPVTVGGTNIGCGSAGGVSLSFNASGVASTTVRYADVGQMSLTASYSGSDGSETGLVMTGTDTFIAAPKDFVLAPSGPYVAGIAFNATVTARNSSGTATPNFGRETTAEGVTLAFTRCQPTGTGTSAGSFSGSPGSFSGGVASASNLVWSEVGNGDLAATLTSGNYLGSGVTAAAGNTGSSGTVCNGAGNVGPFKPHHFDTAVTTHGCGSFTYSGQPFTVQITAMNGSASPAPTVNYDGQGTTTPVFARNVTLSDASSAAGSITNGNSLTAGSFTSGVASGTPTFTFTNKLTGQATLRLRATDTDSVSSATGTEGTTVLRSGRLRLSNAFGPTSGSLGMSVQAQYWSDKSWVLNGNDGCTTLPANTFFLTGGPAATTTASALSLVGGNGTLTLTKSTASTGSVDVVANLGTSGNDQSCLGAHGGTAANKPWLRSQNGSCATTYDRDPSARATFGVYAPETRRVVHVRELY